MRVRGTRDYARHCVGWPPFGMVRRHRKSLSSNPSISLADLYQVRSAIIYAIRPNSNLTSPSGVKTSARREK
jgi:hypothetical protein